VSTLSTVSGVSHCKLSLAPDGGRVSIARRVQSVLAAATIACLPFPFATAQQARWYQLSEQVLQLRQQGKAAEALAPAQETVRVAQATFGADNPHVALSLNELGLLQRDLEKYSDAEASFHQALTIDVKAYGQDNTEVASVLNNIGDLYRIEGRYPEAEKAFHLAMSVHEKVLGPDSPDVAVNASNLAMVYVAEGRYADAEPLYRRVISIDEKAKGSDASGLAIDFSNLADLYGNQGKYADAEPLFIKALSMDIKAHGKDHPVVATDLGNLASTYQNEGKYTSAEPAYLSALAINQKALGPDTSAVAWVLNGLGALYRQQGRYVDAASVLQRALEIRVKVLGADHPDVAETLDNLAGLYADLGKYLQAESLYRHAMDIREKRLGAFHPLVALTIANLALLLRQEGKWAEAETMYRQAMNIDLKSLGPEHPRVAVLLNNMASLFLEEGRLGDAERLLHGALAIDEKAYGPNHSVVAQNLNNLGEVLSDEGKPTEAEPLYKQAISIDEKSLGPNHPEVAASLIGLASAYKDEGKYPEAEPLYKRALAIDEGFLGADHPTTGDAEMSLAVFYYGWDKPDLAGPFFDKRIGNLMAQFKANAAYMSEKDRLMFLATVPGAFPLYFSFALKYHEHDPALAGKIYDVLLEEKGFIAASAAALRGKILASGDKEILAQLDKLTAEKTELAALVSSAQGDPAERRKQIAQLAQQANQLEQEIVKRSQALTDEKTLSNVTWRDVQKALRPGEAAVEFARFPFHNGKSFTSTIDYIALVVTPTSVNPDFIPLGEAQRLESAPIASYRAQVAQTRGVSVESAPGATAQGASVGDTSAAYLGFWKPLEPSLQGVKRVYVSADGVLNQIPMGLLADSNGKLLLEKYQLRTVNSTKDLLRSGHTAPSKSAVLVGDPKFDLTEAAQRVALQTVSGKTSQPSPGVSAPAASIQSSQRAGDLQGAALNSLPGTEVEVAQINTLLKSSGWQANAYTGDRALEEVVRGLRSPRIVHIATHGFFQSDREIAQRARTSTVDRVPIQDPMLRSGLFFAGADRIRAGAPPATGLDDGVLTAYEASQIDLEGTELVVLSACETGLGQQSNSEGVFGLRRGLQEAGAGAVMMSMWSVPDRETQELMELFYAKWLGGLDKPEALRQAQLQERETVRRRYGKDLPFYWGAFVLVSR
jgi:CHAT domain-containing protein/Tfp pilus assembly protein PilF